MDNRVYHLRYTARVVLEALTPVSVGTGNSAIDTDKSVASDCNGLPMIPGTGLCGVLRSLVPSISLDTEDMFGNQEKGSSSGVGSRLVITDALMVGENGLVHDGLASIDWDRSFYRKYKTLPLRDHCRINENGTAYAKKHGKFDELVVYKGTRFVFEMEMMGNDKDTESWKTILSILYSPEFRVGGGTRKGFGAFSVADISTRVFDLTKKSELLSYLDKSSSLSSPFPECNEDGFLFGKNNDFSTVSYVLELVPDDYFLFGSGHGDGDSDATYNTEDYIEWTKDSKTPKFRQEMVLIPATSIKGAILHRTAYHYNRLHGIYADKGNKDLLTEENVAVKCLFGYAKTDEDGNEDGRRGVVLLNDVYVENTGNRCSEKIFNHVSIDRFTGGAIPGALFSEKVVSTGKEPVRVELDIPRIDYKRMDNSVIRAFEMALKDIATGLLPLGGSVMKGHGCFTGTLTRDGEVL